MARLSRVVIPDTPHHITQRGNRRQQTFFTDEDYQYYLDLLAQWCGHFEVRIWAYCLMPNHTHLIAVPKCADGLAKVMEQVHSRYTRYMNFQKGWKGHLWQARYASFPMDDAYLINCARYVELNPVRAKLCQSPQEWTWSSTLSHIEAQSDGICDPAPLLKHVDCWLSFLEDGLSEDEIHELQKRENSNRPLGSEDFVKRLEKLTGRDLLPKKRGPKPKT
jgi:putative transposase